MTNTWLYTSKYLCTSIVRISLKLIYDIYITLPEAEISRPDISTQGELPCKACGRLMCVRSHDYMRPVLCLVVNKELGNVIRAFGDIVSRKQINIFVKQSFALSIYCGRSKRFLLSINR
jgi:hypothetical protein